MKNLVKVFYFELTIIMMHAISPTLANWECPVVITKLGAIRGTVDNFYGKTVDVFLGVPYAIPPIEERRFLKPDPVKPWTEPLEATKMPPACVQFSTRPFPWYDSRSYHSEDCLYLNIWVPVSSFTSSSKKGKAVIYWIHGGGFSMGSNGMPVYDGRVLSALGDVIVVTVNYRLGPLGFIFSGTDDAPGNAGLYDIILGLRWVNDHISAFGGDKNRITIMGESAGSIVIGHIIISPLSKGLFKRAIMASGSPAYLLAEDNDYNFKLTERIAKIVDCSNSTINLSVSPSEVINCMKGVDAFSLSLAASIPHPHSSRTFLVQYGDEALPENPREVIASGNFTGTDLLIGNVLDEGSFQIMSGKPNIFGYFGEREFDFNKSYGQNILQKMFSFLPDAENVSKFYLDELCEDCSEDIRHQVYTASGDYTLLCPTTYFAEKTAEVGNNVYYFLFAHRPSRTHWAPWMGVAHFEDVGFMFGIPLIKHFEYTSEEIFLSEDIIKMLTNFAKKGIPDSKWPLYSQAAPTVRVLDTSVFAVLTFGPHSKSCNFLRPYFGF